MFEVQRPWVWRGPRAGRGPQLVPGRLVLQPGSPNPQGRPSHFLQTPVLAHLGAMSFPALSGSSLGPRWPPGSPGAPHSIWPSPEEAPGRCVGNHTPLPEQMVHLALWGPGLPRAVTGRQQAATRTIGGGGGRAESERRLFEGRGGAGREEQVGQLLPVLQRPAQARVLPGCGPLPRMLPFTPADIVPAPPPQSPSPPSTRLHTVASGPLHHLHGDRPSTHLLSTLSLSGTRVGARHGWLSFTAVHDQVGAL